MATIPEPLNTTARMIYAQYEKNADTGHRTHLGASIIGHHCERFLWLTFHHAKAKKFEGRMYRLFETGKREEARIVQNLRSIGCEVHADDGSSQYAFRALGGHFAGSMDAVITGYHEAPKKWIVVEMKTHSAKSFKDLLEKKVQASKPMHYAQMQTYMGTSGIDRALYFAVNKDTDDIYTEYLHFDQAEFDRLRIRAERIIKAAEPPLKISNDPSWYQCKMCDMANICHGTEAPEVNCRTCCHSTPDTTNGGWSCVRKGTANAVCSDHLYIPALLENFAEMTDASEAGNWVQYRNKLTSMTFFNGDFSSAEIHACTDKSALGDPGVVEIRRELGAVICN